MIASSGNATRSQPARLGLFVGVEDARRVAVEVTDHEVELRGRDSEPGHTARIRDTARMSAGDSGASTSRRCSPRPSTGRPTHRPPAPSSRASIEAHPETADELVDDALVRDGMVALACASRSLSSAVVADADVARPAARPPVSSRASRPSTTTDRAWRGLDRSRRRAASGGGSVASCSASRRATCSASPTSPPSAASSPRSRRSASRSALAFAEPDLPFAVIGMGKLGGRELNYASDVDVLFVHDGDTDARRARSRGRSWRPWRVTTDDGIVFRTDADLRPEGRSGPADPHPRQLRVVLRAAGRQTWEFQALLKARPVAGDAELGARFLDADAAVRVARACSSPNAVREIRAMKERSEELTSARASPTASSSGVAAASATSSSRCSCCSSCTAVTTRTSARRTTLDALARARGRRVRRASPTRRASTTRTGSSGRSSTGSSSTTSSRPTPSRPTSAPARGSPACSATATTATQRALELFESRPPRAPGDRALDPRAALLRADPRRAGRAPVRSRPRPPRSGSRPSGSPTWQRTRAAVARARVRAHAPLAASCSSSCRVILEWLSDDAGSRPRPAPAAPARRGPGPVCVAGDDVPRRPGRRRAHVPSCSGRAASSATRCAVSPSSSTRSPTTTTLADETPRASELVDRRARDARVARRSDDARREGLRRFKRRELLRIAARDLLGVRAPRRRPNASSPRSPRRASRPRSRASSRRCRSR